MCDSSLSGYSPGAIKHSTFTVGDNTTEVGAARAYLAMDRNPQSKLFKIEFETEDLNAIRLAVDEAVKYREAKAVEVIAGRAKALEALAGKSVMCDRTCPNSLSIVKRVSLGTKKRKGRPCCWPSKKEDRERVRKRTEERRAQGLESPFAKGRLSRDGTVYIPSLREEKTLKNVSAKIAEHLAIDPLQLRPKAVVSCVEPSNATKRHRQSGWCIQVAINQGTKRIDVTEAHPSANPRAPEMHTGEVFAFSGSEAHRFPPTQWQRDLLFTAYNDAM